MTKLLFRTVLSSVVLAVAGMTLAGCSLSTAPYGIFDTGPVASSTSSPKATPSAAPLSEFDKQVAAQTAPRDYVLPSGRSVVVDPKAPLPEVVAEAIAQGAAPISAPLRGTQAPDARGASLNSLGDYADEQAALVGQGVVLVFPSSSVDGPAWGTLTSGGNHVTGLTGRTNKASMIAEAQAYASTMGRNLIVIG